MYTCISQWGEGIPGPPFLLPHTCISHREQGRNPRSSFLIHVYVTKEARKESQILPSSFLLPPSSYMYISQWGEGIPGPPFLLPHTCICTCTCVSHKGEGRNPRSSLPPSSYMYICTCTCVSHKGEGRNPRSSLPPASYMYMSSHKGGSKESQVQTIT